MILEGTLSPTAAIKLIANSLVNPDVYSIILISTVVFVFKTLALLVNYIRKSSIKLSPGPGCSAVG